MYFCLSFSTLHTDTKTPLKFDSWGTLKTRRTDGFLANHSVLTRVIRRLFIFYLLDVLKTQCSCSEILFCTCCLRHFERFQPYVRAAQPFFEINEYFIWMNNKSAFFYWAVSVLVSFLLPEPSLGYPSFFKLIRLAS